jgi:hypothetical protein
MIRVDEELTCLLDAGMVNPMSMGGRVLETALDAPSTTLLVAGVGRWPSDPFDHPFRIGSLEVWVFPYVCVSPQWGLTSSFYIVVVKCQGPKPRFVGWCLRSRHQR